MKAACMELPVPGHQELTVVVKRSARAKRLTLRVGRVDGKAHLTLPGRTPLREAEAFIARQAIWLAKAVAARPTTSRPAIGGTIPFRGEQLPLLQGSRGPAKRNDEGILCPPDPTLLGPRLAALLKAEARNALTAASHHYATQLGVTFNKITLRDTRSRWGSCTSRGDLMYSWRLIMAPVEVLEYVAAHEVAHLRYMDHSPRFWATVESLMPGYHPRREWLKQNGAGLLAWDFKGAEAKDT